MLALLYCALGVLGYISYVYDIPNLIIFRPTLGGINKSEDWPMVAGRFMVCIYLNMAIPLNLNPLRKSIEFFITG